MNNNPALPAYPDVSGYVDANVIISYLLADPPDMAAQARGIFMAADRGDVVLNVTLLTLAEVVWVLGTTYRRTRSDIASQLITFIAADGLAIEGFAEATLALSLYRDLNVDFADALLAARGLLIGPPVVYSFDHHFDRLPGIERRNPGQAS